MPDLHLVTDYPCLLGEGPVWDSTAKRILWVDILQGDIHQFFLETGKHEIFNCKQQIGAIALRAKGGLIAALQSGFARIDIDNGAIELIADPESGIADNRFNDGKCDPAGRFWAGTMSNSDVPGAGSLYTLEHDLRVTLKIEGLSCPNGLAWNRVEKALYFIDSPTNSINAFDYDLATGEVKNERIIVTIPKSEGLPDGMTIDSDGMLWVALWDGWKVSRYSPDTGDLLYSISLPVSRVTSCTFGGENLEDIYITTARVGLSSDELRDQPWAGCLFVVKNSGFKGLPTVKFRG